MTKHHPDDPRFRKGDSKSRYHQGRFNPNNPQKYKGDPSNIWYRSSWELKFMMECDRNPQILEYQSEETIIPYRSPLDGNIHRYFPDFIIKVKGNDNVIRTIMIEIKPYNQTLLPLPKKGKKPTKKLINEIATYGVNKAKWDAAEEYCKDRLWSFKIMTEYELGI